MIWCKHIDIRSTPRLAQFWCFFMAWERSWLCWNNFKTTRHSVQKILTGSFNGVRSFRCKVVSWQVGSLHQEVDLLQNIFLFFVVSDLRSPRTRKKVKKPTALLRAPNLTLKLNIKILSFFQKWCVRTVLRNVLWRSDFVAKRPKRIPTIKCIYRAGKVFSVWKRNFSQWNAFILKAKRVFGKD